MEGFLWKKGRGDSSFGRRNWKERWFVLDGQELSYYEDFDLATGEPVGFKGSANIANCECFPVEHHEKKFTFVIQPKNDKEIHVSAPEAKLMNLWMKEIATAARGEKPPTVINYDEAYRLLGLNMSDNPSASDVNRAYRKAALKCHPDKGGDLDEFEKIQKAFNNIMAKMDEEEFEQQHTTIVYDVLLRKEPGDIGLGMVVVEDQAKRIIQIKDLIPGMKIESLAASAQGALKPGDILVAVAGVNVRNMPLSRVAQKLNTFRVPVHSTVQLSFERKVPKASLDPNGEFVKPEEKADSTVDPRHNDIHHTDPISTKTDISSTINNDPVTNSVLAENDELKADLFAKMKALEAQRQENLRLEKELERHKSFLRTQSQEKILLEEQLKISYASSRISKEQLSESMNQLLKVSQLVSSGKDLMVSIDIKKILEKENLTEDKVQDDPLKGAQRIAIAAALKADVFDLTRKKWSHENESLAARLQRFEEKILSLNFGGQAGVKTESMDEIDGEKPSEREHVDSAASISTLGLGSVSHLATDARLKQARN